MDFIFTLSWLLCALVLLAGCCIQTVIGFGMAVLAAPVFMLLAPEWVPYVLSTSALVTSGLNAWHLRRSVSLAAMLPAMLTRIPGTVIGVGLLLSINLFWLHVTVAAAVLVAVFASLFPVKFEATRSRLGWAGFVSGFMGTTTSIGGPPMALVMQHGKPEEVRANLSVYFVFSCVVSLTGYGVSGLLNMKVFMACLTFVPIAIIGFSLGKVLHKSINGGVFRPLLLGLCGISSVVALMGVLATGLPV